MIASSLKYITSTKNYLETALNVDKLLRDKSGGLDLLTSMILEHISQKVIYKGEDITKALKYYSNWICDLDVEQTYSKLYELFDTYLTLTKSLIERSQKSVESIVLRRHFLFGDNIDLENVRMLEKLKEKKSMEVFFVYLTSLTRGATITFHSK